MRCCSACLVLLWCARLSAAAEGYEQLPGEQVCALFYKQCEEDCREILTRMDLVSGWRRRELSELRSEAERLRAIWYAAWWVAWKEARESQQHEWAEILIGYIGQDAFWRAEIPLPLSLR